MLSRFSIHGTDQCEPSKTPKRRLKRAKAVCCRCHDKKIKCDIQLIDGPGIVQCSNCLDAGVPCQQRSSKRAGSKRQADVIQTELFDPPSAIAETDTMQQVVRSNSVVLSEGLADSQETRHSDGQTEQRYSVANDPAFGINSQDCGSSHSSYQRSYLGDSGYMTIFSNDNSSEAMSTSLHTSFTGSQPIDNMPAVLCDTHLDVYFEFAYTWCPVLDRATYYSCPQFRQSLLLKHALALCSNQIRPTLVEQASSVDHYKRAKELFYTNHESNPLVAIISLMLFYWFSADRPNTVGIDNTWWWTGVVIRLAQQMRLHRHSSSTLPQCEGDSPGLRRRIWWTLVARERISCISQGRPCVIDPADCTNPMPTKEDFPDPDGIGTSVFLSWLNLCDIVGDIGTKIRRDLPFSEIASGRTLIQWVESLPSSLHLPIGGERTMFLYPEVHGIYLTYFSTITLIHLNKCTKLFPQASTAAVVAASCTARIFYDYLLRGSLRFLAGQAGWYIIIAILALAHSRRVEGIGQAAERDIKILQAAIKEMARLWPSSRVFEEGIEKLLNMEPKEIVGPIATMENCPPSLDRNDSLSSADSIDWRAYFPFISAETSPLIGILLFNSPAMAAKAVPEIDLAFNLSPQLNNFLLDSEMFELNFLNL